MTGGTLQTEFEFTLPQGYVDDEGTLHKEGRMRLATAADEIEPLQSPRVQSNSSYLTLVLLSRVVTELGDLETIDVSVIEDLFVSDLEYLQALYERINNQGVNAVETACPECGERFEVDAESGAHLTTDGASSPMTQVGRDAGATGVGGDLGGIGTIDSSGLEATEMQAASVDSNDGEESTPGNPVE
ncbi:hypothetical protein [Natrinema hispanicum]|uniref:Phage tail assembly protein n=1 Tax=Natrinema hispanicum TaxID=392421 RepID=A0A1I0E7B3_9EURY|nr:hypothetical protein [Natrinema hispanicum]SDC67762.1 hypothetical protein SAMN05192552_100663 [Natrinema hispanicum]SET41065.1 hypothetical protein SAMN04488694_106132 [Natrinema hispanicum]